MRRGLSAGRVQSVAVRLVCEREREIRAFESVEYWSLAAQLEGRLPPSFRARLFQWQGQKLDNKNFRLENEAHVQQIIQLLEGASWTVGEVEKKERRRYPTPPFVTSKLQQEAARKLGFQPKRTMQLAQQLYEGVELGNDGLGRLDHLYAYRFDAHFRRRTDRCARNTFKRVTERIIFPENRIRFARKRAHKTRMRRFGRQRLTILPSGCGVTYGAICSSCTL